MTVKSLLRFLIGFVIGAVLLLFGLPYAGIPRSQVLPPVIAYSNATGKTTGVISQKRQEPTSNPFYVSDKVPIVEFKFRAKAPHLLMGKPEEEGKEKLYTGHMAVSADTYAAAKEGATVPIRYATDYPVISGITQAGYGRNGAQGSGILSGWIIWFLVNCVIAYVVAPLLERIFLRESY